jgi:hypothetical protein
VYRVLAVLSQRSPSQPVRNASSPQTGHFQWIKSGSGRNFIFKMPVQGFPLNIFRQFGAELDEAPRFSEVEYVIISESFFTFGRRWGLAGWVLV